MLSRMSHWVSVAATTQSPSTTNQSWHPDDTAIQDLYHPPGCVYMWLLISASAGSFLGWSGSNTNLGSSRPSFAAFVSLSFKEACISISWYLYGGPPHSSHPITSPHLCSPLFTSGFTSPFPFTTIVYYTIVTLVPSPVCTVSSTVYIITLFQQGFLVFLTYSVLTSLGADSILSRLILGPFKLRSTPKEARYNTVQE